MKKAWGIPDEDFIRGKVPMTKREVRILTMAKAEISPKDTVWDVGAGTGSMSVEAALLAPEGRVYAVERKGEGASLIRQNAEKFGAKNITVVEGEAPEALDLLPECDAVIIGGSGSRLAEILDKAAEKLADGGRVVINSVTIQTLSEAVEYFRRKSEAFTYEAVCVQVTRLEAVGRYDMMKALNPIYILTAKKNPGRDD